MHTTTSVAPDGPPKSLTWEREEELILKEWGEKALCFKWLHTRMHKRYQKLNMRVTIPVIVLSTLTGTANFAQGRVPEGWRESYPMMVGTLNIVAGIISTIAQYFKISEINEGHRVAAMSWDKFARNIKIQLAKRRTNREEVAVLMKYAKDEYDRLTEISPTISDETFDLFSKRVRWKKETVDEPKWGDEIDQPKQLKGLARPSICDTLVPIHIYVEAADEEAQETQEAQEETTESATEPKKNNT